MSKVLMVHPDFSRLGGIENYLLKIKPHLRIEHESCGNSRRPGERGLGARLRRILADYYRYCVRISHPDVRVVHLNPSLQPRMFYRDFVYLWIARLLGRKVVVFFHGWDTGFQHKIDRQRGRIFRWLYGGADAFIVLADDFRERLCAWGITRPIYQEVIVIEDEVFASVRLEELLLERRRAAVRQVLFPSRLIRAKGIYTLIQAFGLVQRQHPATGLVIAGDGDDAEAAARLAADLGLAHTRFTGIVSGEEKYDLFRNAHLLCFPTEHPEGFPNTIVEAMAFGLPVITRPVGGVKDFFIDGEHGYLSESTEPAAFAELIERLLGDDGRYDDIARANHAYAAQHFLASQAAARLERIYRSL